MNKLNYGNKFFVTLLMAAFGAIFPGATTVIGQATGYLEVVGSVMQDNKSL